MGVVLLVPCAMSPLSMDRDLLKQQLKYTLEGTDFDDQGELYRGKVRDNYVNEDTITMVTTDRISAFDRVLGTVPFKGQALVELADWWFGETADIVANHVMRRPHPNVWTVRRCDPIQVEMVVRGYITGVTSTSAWTAYEKGDRNFCGNELPDGMRKNEKLPEPIITPSTKAVQGEHDESVTPSELYKRGVVDPALFKELSRISMRLYERGVSRAADKGLIFVDTKYEFGISKGKIMLMDEVNTPDSSRYWMADDYEKRFEKGEEPRKLDKEYVRTWLAEKGFTGDGKPPKLTDKLRVEAAARYMEVVESFTEEPMQLEVGPVDESIYSILNPFAY
jgi:phosphoribosylaminoimidazole-succinocarboxamide synthase|tara:strand:+ start:36 stop:1043 length:1008 start_codon:yes stop_codon:yes gene_type:complete